MYTIICISRTSYILFLHCQDDAIPEELEVPCGMPAKRQLSLREQVCTYFASLYDCLFSKSDVPSKKVKSQASPVHEKEEIASSEGEASASKFQPFDYSSKRFSDIKKGEKWVGHR